MRVSAGIILLIALVAVSEAAVLVRFINTVPTRKYQTSLNNYVASGIQAQTTPLQEWIWPHPTWAQAPQGQVTTAQEPDTAQLYQDLVGLYYLHSGNIAQRSVVWTDTLDWIWGDEKRASLMTQHLTGVQALSKDDLVTAFAVKNAMPPLRGYHRPLVAAASSEAEAADRVVNQDARSSPEIPYRPAVADYYTPDALRADGVGLYMSFAAGTYDFQAYGIRSHEKYFVDQNNQIKTNPAYPETPLLFTRSAIKLSFEDNKVYTLVATGAGSWTDIDQNTVALYSIEESTQPTKFGMAAIRFYHAIQPQAANAIDIYRGPTSTTPIHEQLPFSTATTDYFDLEPKRAEVFPVAIRTTNQNGGTSPVLLTNAANSPSVSFDVIAGLRATAICGSSFEDRTSEVFCRMIPSRVVTYVRLIADTAGYDILVDGRLGPQKLSDTPLTLWGSYELPKPAQTWTGSRDVSNAANAGIPAASVGLYPIVSNVAPGSVSGYGEVLSPIFIMDFAATPRLAPSCDDHIQSQDYSTTANTLPTTTANVATNAIFEDGMGHIPSVSGSLCHNRATRSYQLGQYSHLSGLTKILKRTPVPTTRTDTMWHEHSPIFKRINMILKTDGMATVSNACDEERPNPSATAGASGNSVQRSATLTDLYMEPGEYYSVYVLPTVEALDTCTTRTSGFNIQRRGGLRFGYSRDISLSEANQGVPTDKAYVSFFPIGDSTNWANYPTTGTGSVEGSIVTQTTSGTALTTALIAASGIQHQQDFQGLLKINDGSAASNSFTILPNTFNYREAEKAPRFGELTGATIAAGGTMLSMGLKQDATKGSTLAYPQTDWAGLESQLASSAAAATWYVSPLAPTAFELIAGEHTISHTSTRDATTKATAFDCFGHIPSDTFTVEAGKRYHYFVLNQFGCVQDVTGTARTDADTSQLRGVLVEVSAFVPTETSSTTTEAVANFFSSAESALTGSASSLASSMVVLVAALLSVLAIVF